MSQCTTSLFAQFGHPRGVLGRVAGRVMAWENARANELVVDQLGIRREDAVLEVGSGPGVAVRAALARATRGFAAGVDPSPVMVSQARRRNAKALRAGRAEIVLGAAERLQYPNGRFTRALSVNSLGHWDDVRGGVAELHRVLAPGGQLALAFRAQRNGRSADPHADGATPSEIDSLISLLRDGGFESIERRDHDLGRETLVTLLARRDRQQSDR